MFSFSRIRIRENTAPKDAVGLVEEKLYELMTIIKKLNKENIRLRKENERLRADGRP